MALCCLCFWYLFYMGLLHWLCLLASLTLPLIMTNFLSKCTESILAVSSSPSLYPCDASSSSYFTAQPLLLWHTFLKCLVLPQPAHVFPYAGHCLGTCTLPQYWHGHCCDVRPSGPLVPSSFSFFAIFTLSNGLNSVIVFKSAAWALCASTLFAQASIPPLVMWSSSFMAVKSFIISSSMYFHLTHG